MSAPKVDAKRSRPFCVLGVQQVAIAGDRSRLRRLWVDILGVPISHTERHEAENVEEDMLELGVSPYSVQVDLLEPIDPNRKPRVLDRPLNHVGLWVDDIHAAVRWLEEQGVRIAPPGIRHGAQGREICFIHPSANEKFPIGGEGVLIELVQAPAQVIEAFSTAR